MKIKKNYLIQNVVMSKSMQIKFMIYNRNNNQIEKSYIFLKMNKAKYVLKVK